MQQSSYEMGFNKPCQKR
uniref:Uncharacterized protein n=1 Tax=Arundo donax TaxID=35708 RepID=A0A0A9ENB1_ARUDO